MSRTHDIELRNKSAIKTVLYTDDQVLVTKSE
jgi:hypothetical protein